MKLLANISTYTQYPLRLIVTSFHFIDANYRTRADKTFLMKIGIVI